MRLSDYKNEEALDLIAEIIEPASAIMSDEKVMEMVRGKKNKMLLVSYILKHHKDSTMEVIAALHRTTKDKVQFNAVSVINDLLDVLNDPEIEMLFSSQGQTSDTSGSATETTTGVQ